MPKFVDGLSTRLRRSNPPPPPRKDYPNAPNPTNGSGNARPGGASPIRVGNIAAGHAALHHPRSRTEFAQHAHADHLYDEVCSDDGSGEYDSWPLSGSWTFLCRPGPASTRRLPDAVDRRSEPVYAEPISHPFAGARQIESTSSPGASVAGVDEHYVELGFGRGDVTPRIDAGSTYALPADALLLDVSPNVRLGRVEGERIYEEVLPLRLLRCVSSQSLRGSASPSAEPTNAMRSHLTPNVSWLHSSANAVPPRLPPRDVLRADVRTIAGRQSTTL
jgi:hypothetical protein